MFKRFVDFCKACYGELRYKTTWPTTADLTRNAAVVLCASVIIAIAVWGVDSVIKYVMSSFIYPH
jgi:preprotein translocase subunit SecE